MSQSFYLPVYLIVLFLGLAGTGGIAAQSPAERLLAGQNALGQNNLGEALFQFEEGARQAENGADASVLGELFYEAARLYELRGQAEPALEKIQGALDQFATLGDAGSNQIARASLVEARLWESRLEITRAYGSLAVAIFQSRKGADKGNGSLQNEALVRLGRLYLQSADRFAREAWHQQAGLSQPDKELRELRGAAALPEPVLNRHALALSCARRVLKAVLEKSDLRWEVEALLLEGQVLQSAGQPDKAELSFQAAKTKLNNGGYAQNALMTNVLLSLGQLRIEQGQAAEALALAESGLSGTGTPDLREVSPFPQEYFQLLSLKGAALLRQGKYPEALGVFEEAQKTLGTLRNAHRGQRAESMIGKFLRDFSEDAMTVCWAMYKQNPRQDIAEKAYAFAEHARDCELITAMRDLEARKVMGVPENLVRREEALHRDLAAYESLLDQALRRLDAQDDAKALQERMAQVRGEYFRLLDTFKTQYGAYHSLRFVEGGSPLKEVQQSLESDMTLVEYLRTDSLVLAVVVDAQQVTLHGTAYQGKMPDLVIPFMVSLKSSDYEKFINYSPQLYDLLIRPLGDRLRNRKLLFVPDEELNYVSFELLLESAPTNPNGDFRELPYLLRKHITLYSYSGSMYVRSLARSKSLAPKKTFLGMAPDFDQVNQMALRSRIGDSEDTSSIFSKLPSAIKEVNAISTFLKGNAFTGAAANEVRFKREAPDYAIIHLATHTVINNNNPLRSKLVLVDSAGDDGMLNTYELYDLELNAELVALSACNSGIGNIHEGEGVVSLARGFTHAGCPNVVMSLWPVPDASTKDIMERLYHYLREGMSKGEALQRAKLDYLNNANRITGSPFFWGGFVVVGNDLPIDWDRLYGKKTDWRWYVGGGVGALALLLGIVGWRMRRKAF